ncbi:MAG: hypothetical protein MJ229_00565 [bacterium]|nr:hypothetical protein [bacterium]
MRISSIQNNSFYFKKAKPSFASKVIYEKSNYPLSQNAKDFIDKFEELPEPQKKEECKYLGSGMTGSAYYTPLFNFVIKQSSRPNDYKNSRDYKGSLYQENDVLLALNPHVEHTQYGIAYVETEKGGKFLISTLVDGKKADVNNNPLNNKKLDRLLRTLYRLDKNGILNTDLSSSNILYTDDNYANIIDYQWGEKFKPGCFTSFKYVSLPGFEEPSNMNMFEGASFAGYLERCENPRELLKDYLLLKAHYTEKKIDFLERQNGNSYYIDDRIDFEKAKLEAYKNPTDDVLNAELLKMTIMKEHRRQYNYIDIDINDENKNILEMFNHCVLGTIAAETLSKYTSSDNEKYFYYMRQYGEYYNTRNKKDYTATMEWIAKMCAGTESRLSSVFKQNKIMNISSDYNSLISIKFNSMADNLKLSELIRNKTTQVSNITRNCYEMLKGKDFLLDNTLSNISRLLY